MKLLSVIVKSFREQIRSFWIFILTISMAPFFVLVYYLISETSKPHYDVLVVSYDKGVEINGEVVNYAEMLLDAADLMIKDTIPVPLSIRKTETREGAIGKVKNRKADALVIIPENFSASLEELKITPGSRGAEIELIGDLSSIEYMVSVIWAGEVVDYFVSEVAGITRPLNITETSLGISGKADDFDLYMPGIIILSVIMLMFSASIAFVYEVENRTIIRLKLSRVKSLTFLSGVSFIQVLTGLLSMFLTFLMAVWFGFDFSGSFGLMILIVVLTCISIISFSLIIAAVTKTVNEILIVANFPLFLFMFFTGAAFPIGGKELFSVAGYGIAIQGLMSPTHAVSALKKVAVLGMGWNDIIPEIASLIILTLVYFVIGVLAFRRRHMRVL